jgi:hypothetical protein
MDGARWNEAQLLLWRVADRADLLELSQRARQAARTVLTPLLAHTPTSCAWTEEKAHLLEALDAAGLTAVLHNAHQGITLPLALAVGELASVDAGAATCSLSGSLAQMPIRDFGTQPQRERYLRGLRHGALCLTEPLPGAGAEAISLSGRISLAGTDAQGEPLIDVTKRGRFTSHMDFAEFVLVAVEGDGQGVRGSGLVILEPHDAGEFDRGVAVHKLGHRWASTTDPSFRLRVPAARLVGGFTIEQGAVVPLLNHRVLLEPALRRMRALLGLMTAAKALATVQAHLPSLHRGEDDLELRLHLADLWADGEAAASLGFSAARASDELDCAQASNAPASLAQVRLAALLAPAAKLFSSSRIPESLQRVGACFGQGSAASLAVQARLIDAQIEEMYMGPAALQRRLVSSVLTGAPFLSEFQQWTEEIDALAQRLPHTGLGSFAEAMRLWLWTLERLRQSADARGGRLYCDARQSVTFAMADALCGLLAARSLALDLAQANLPLQTAERSILADLGTLAAGRAAMRTAQISTDLLFASAPRFPVSEADRAAFAQRRADLYRRLRGMMDARERIAEYLRGQRAY